jgi:hypothetical protein
LRELKAAPIHILVVLAVAAREVKMRAAVGKTFDKSPNNSD